MQSLFDLKSEEVRFPYAWQDEWRKVCLLTCMRMLELEKLSFGREDLREFDEAFSEAIEEVTKRA